MIDSPRLPEWLGRVALRRLRVGPAEVDLEYRRMRDRTVASVLGVRGPLEVRVA